MEKEAQRHGPTLGTLEHQIMMDQRLEAWQKQFIMNNLRNEIGHTPQGKNTPLSEILPRVGGGVLGFLIAKYFKMGLMGQAISTAAGYGVGKVIADFYTAYKQFSGDTGHMWRRSY